MKTVLLCGEGVHDIGRKDWDSRTGDHVYLEGWMQPLVRKIADCEISIQTRLLRELVLFPRPKNLKPIPKGQRDKAAIARIVASFDKCNVIVFMTDADSADEAIWKVKIQEIREGFELAANAVSGVPCVPKSSSECWLLSDIKAWESMGLQVAGEFPSTKAPENLWGERNDPEGDHPKKIFARVCEDAGVEDNRETRKSICEASSINVMKARCPVSFHQFADELMAALK